MVPDYRYWRRMQRPYYPYGNIPPNPESPYGYPRVPFWGPQMSKENELKMLEEEEAMLEDALEDLRKRKKELQKEVK